MNVSINLSSMFVYPAVQYWLPSESQVSVNLDLLKRMPLPVGHLATLRSSLLARSLYWHACKIDFRKKTDILIKCTFYSRFYQPCTLDVRNNFVTHFFPNNSSRNSEVISNMIPHLINKNHPSCTSFLDNQTS